MQTKTSKSSLRKLKLLFDFLNYDYRLTSWRFLNRYRRFAERFSKCFDIVRRGVILVICALIAHIIVRLVEPSSLSASTFANYFISIGAMGGGIIAIVFTLSIFVKQNAADLYSSQYFEVYTHDLVERFTFSTIVLLTIVFFGLGIWLNQSQIYLTHNIHLLLVYGSLLGIGLIFVLVDWQYKNVRKKVNPLVALDFLEESIRNSLNNIHKDANRIAGIIKAKNKKTSEKLALASAYYNYLQPRVLALNRRIENLFEISLRLSKRHEVKATNRGLAAIHNILCRFLELRKDSSFIIPSRVFLAFESDSHRFLTAILENLNKAGEEFVREHKSENAVYLIDLYKSLAIHSKDIEFIGRSYENPIFEAIKGYLSSYVEFAAREKEEEILFQASTAFGDLALIAIEKNLQAPLLGIQGDLYKIALFGIAEKKTFIIDECYNSWLNILRAVFQNKLFVAKLQVSEVLKNLERTTVLVWASLSSGYLQDDFITRMSLGKPYDDFGVFVSDIVEKYMELRNEEDRKFYRPNLVVLFEELNGALRRLSEKIKTCDAVLVDSIGRLIFQSNSSILALLEEEYFGNHPEELLTRLAWNIHLPTWFVHHVESFTASHAFNTLTESIAKTGLMLFRRSVDDGLIVDCIEALHSMTKQALKKMKNGYGFSEPRLMLRICYLGVLGLKHNKQDILREVGVRIYEFEELYQEKYLSDLKLPEGVEPEKILGLPKKDQLFLEVLGWRNDLVREKYTRHRLIDDAREMMFDLVDQIDIDRFMFEVWGRFPSGSPMEQEIKTTQMKRLVNALKHISGKRKT